MEAEAMAAAEARAGTGLLRKTAADHCSGSDLFDRTAWQSSGLESSIERLMKRCEGLRARKRFFANKVEETNADGGEPSQAPPPQDQQVLASDPQQSMELDLTDSAAEPNSSAQHAQQGQNPASHDASMLQAPSTKQAEQQQAERAHHSSSHETIWESGVRAESGIALAIGPWAHTSSSPPVTNQGHVTAPIDLIQDDSQSAQTPRPDHLQTTSGSFLADAAGPSNADAVAELHAHPQDPAPDPCCSKDGAHAVQTQLAQSSPDAAPSQQPQAAAAGSTAVQATLAAAMTHGDMKGDPGAESAQRSDAVAHAGSGVTILSDSNADAVAEAEAGNGEDPAAAAAILAIAAAQDADHAEGSAGRSSQVTSLYSTHALTCFQRT